ncbi:MAG: TIGR01777 family oxidoreductase [Deltaproteobacteria bacterium]
MKIVIAGGTGQIGKILSRAFLADGHEVVILSRRPGNGPAPVVAWDAETLGDWATEIDGADAVVNLAGRSVNCRYTPQNRRLIMDSRVRSTRVVGEAIARAARPPRVWLQASTATIYCHRYEAANDEATGIPGGTEDNVPDTWRFSIDVATAWERAALEAISPRTRLVLLRSAMTMSPDRGGVFDVLLGLVRHGLGGRHGNGRQHMSWIHEWDFVRALYWLIDHDEMEGPINLTAPHPLPNAEFMRILREAWGIRIGLPATEWMLEIGTFLMRSESELILKSRRVVPRRLLESGFEFKFPAWRAAAADLCRRWRELHRAGAGGANSARDARYTVDTPAAVRPREAGF